MKQKKRPDNVVYNEEQKRYDAALKPYATNASAPVITTPDTVTWKNKNIHSVNKQIEAKYQELKSAYDSLMDQYYYNEIIYSSKFNFEPVVGELYHLYRDKNQSPFLSIISPSECNFDFIGSAQWIDFNIKLKKICFL